MTEGRGRHVSSGSSAFIRDLIVMGVGIVIVAVLLYGALSLIAGLGDDGTDAGGTTVPTTNSGGAATTTSTTAVTTSSSTTTTTAAATTTTVIEVRAPEEITVIVLNSTNRSGIAGALTASLAEMGYQTLEADNYAESLDQSRVWHAPDFAAEAAELKELAVPDALTGVYEGPDLGAHIVVVLGASYQG